MVRSSIEDVNAWSDEILVKKTKSVIKQDQKKYPASESSQLTSWEAMDRSIQEIDQLEAESNPEDVDNDTEGRRAWLLKDLRDQWNYRDLTRIAVMEEEEFQKIFKISRAQFADFRDDIRKEKQKEQMRSSELYKALRARHLGEFKTDSTSQEVASSSIPPPRMIPAAQPR